MSDLTGVELYKEMLDQGVSSGEVGCMIMDHLLSLENVPLSPYKNDERQELQDYLDKVISPMVDQELAISDAELGM